MASNLARRIAFAVVAIPSVLGIAFVGGWALAGLIAVAGALGAREVYGFARAQGIEPLERLGILSAALVPFAVAWTILGPRDDAGLLARVGGSTVLLVWLLGVLTVALLRRAPDRRPLAATAITILAVLYAGWLLSFALLLRHPIPHAALDDRPVGTALLAYPLVLTWVGDSLAMAGGKTFGGPKLTPLLSPNKTWSGAASGLFGTTALSLIYAAAVFRHFGVSMSLIEAAGLGALIGIAAQIGDAVESLMKREVGFKDSSTLIPGHGGVLDRLDSLYFVLPTTALLYRLVGVA